MSEAALPAPIQAMLSPQIYPHPVREPIELIQTHASFVVLTGDYAYKIKKAVDFGFFDYSTLEKRHHFCSEELRLNRRMAPDLYLDLVILTKVNSGSHVNVELNGSGSVVEYAVKMKQFPQEALLSYLFDQGQLTEDHLVQWGKVIAQFHAQAETNDRIRSFGQVDQIKPAFDQNYQQTQVYIGGPQTQDQFDQTRAFTDRFFLDHADHFAERIQQNRIRECHGDLHLRNICLWQGKILPFDCIEFNEAFRFVDVMYDLAYGVVDLQAGDRVDLANAYLNTYLEETGDWVGLKVLPIYLIRQAYVRAKVTSFLLKDPSLNANEYEQLQDPDHVQIFEKAARYYRLAWQYTQPRQGQLILMSGLSGSGKSTVARYVARQVNGIQIRSDAVRKHLAGISIHARGDQGIYSAAMTQATYRRLEELGIQLAQQGYSVILDAKYDRPELRESVIEAAEQYGIPLEILHCFAPTEVLRQRLQERSGDITDATVDLLDRQQQAWTPFSAKEQPYVVPLDTSHRWQDHIPA